MAHAWKVWEATLDGRYRCTVVREEPYWGRLIIIDTKTDEELLWERVSLAHGATFGPDDAGVHRWQERAVEVVEGGKD